MSLKHKIVYWRMKRNLSQRELADKIGVSQQAVAKWEVGSSKPTLDNVKNIADALDVALTDLFDP